MHTYMNGDRNGGLEVELEAIRRGVAKETAEDVALGRVAAHVVVQDGKDGCC